MTIYSSFIYFSFPWLQYGGGKTRKGGEVACVAGIFKWQSQAVFSSFNTESTANIQEKTGRKLSFIEQPNTHIYSSSLNCHILPGQWCYCSSFIQRELTFRKFEVDQDCAVIKLCPPSPNLKMIRRSP